MLILINFQYMNYGYGPQEMGTAQDLVVRAGRRADPPIHDAYGCKDDNFILVTALFCN